MATKPYKEKRLPLKKVIFTIDAKKHPVTQIGDEPPPNKLAFQI